MKSEKSKVKNWLVVSTIALGVLALVRVYDVKSAKAQGTSNYPPIIENLVERFGLNEDEVKTFFDEQKEEHQQQKQQNREERLNEAVADGVITEEQKQALQNKWEEMKTERQQHREEMRAWFEEQGIDHEALRQYDGFGHRGGFGGRGHWFGK